MRTALTALFTKRLLPVLLLATLALSACGGGSTDGEVKVIEVDLDEVTPTTQPQDPATEEAAPEDTVAEVEEPTVAPTPAAELTVAPTPAAETEATASPETLITVATGPLTVFDGPGGSVLAELPATTQFGSPTTLAVLELGEEWVQVGGLPIRPNGSVGYIPRAAADLRRVSFSIEVDLDARMLSVYSGADLYLESPVAVGAEQNPTPSGHLFVVTDVLDTGDPNSPYGRYAIGLSGLSDQLTEFAGGPGQIGIHGTNDPASIGQAVSSGCVRVPADVAAQLAGVLPLGTPVVIT